MAALQKEDLWEKTREQILEHHGDIEDIAEIPDHIKKIYKTSFSVSPYAYVEVAARAQKWVDMGISRNMYLDIRDIDEIMNIYTTAWDKGLKTTYYLHMKPRHSAEQSTTSVNKSEALGKRGFAVLRDKQATTPKAEEIQKEEVREESMQAMMATPINVVASPIIVQQKVAATSQPLKVHLPEDPQDQLLCEGCQ
jgi:ribonucleotide reductase alpha subunit